MASARNVTRGTIVAGDIVVARTLWQKFRGLMGQPSIAAGTGLWFPGTNSIHMMFMRFAIDCVFLNRPENGTRTVVAVRRALRPWTGVVWYARGAHGVIELPVGAIDASGTAIGDALALDGVD